MNIQNLRFKLGMTVAALVLVLAGSGCGSNSKKPLKVGDQSYPECSDAVISDFNQMARSYNRAFESGLTSSEQQVRLVDLEKELTIYFERHLNEGPCAAPVKESDQVSRLTFPANREELETRVKETMERIREKISNA